MSKPRSPRFLARRTYESVWTLVEDYSGPKDSVEQVVLEAVLKALSDRRLLQRLRLFRTPPTTKPRQKVVDFYNDVRNESGYLLKVGSHFVDRNGLKIPLDFVTKARMQTTPLEYGSPFDGGCP